MPDLKTERKLTAKQKRAAMAQSTGEAFAADLAQEMGLYPELAIQRGPIKDIARIFEKAEGRCKGRIEEVNDVSRCKLIFKTPYDFVKARQILSQYDNTPGKFVKKWKNHNVKIIEFEDNYAEPKPHGFIGANLVIEIDLGKNRSERYEVQFMHENMQLTDQITHRLYEEIRTLQEGAVIRAVRAATEPVEVPDRRKQKKEYQAFLQKVMTNEEKAAVAGYEKTTKNLYEADAYNYGLTLLQKQLQPASSHNKRTKDLS
ncbi:MAG: hypothetical protein R3E13_08975 [Alphaproteobacteria bacterium]